MSTLPDPVTAPSWMLPAVLPLADLGPLEASISHVAGQSSAVSPLTMHAGFLFKRYLAATGPDGAARLDRLVALPGRYPAVAPLLQEGTSWPVARVTGDAGSTVGCVIRRAPKRFSAVIGGGAASARLRLLEIDLLAMPDASLARRRLPIPTATERFDIARHLLRVAAVLESMGLVYSDWSYSNALWSTDGQAFVIDIDGCHESHGPNICQPNWEDPLTPRSRPADALVDRYRVGLLVARCLTARRPVTDVLYALADRERGIAAPLAEALLDVLLAVRREDRPSASTVLTAAEEELYAVTPGVRRPFPLRGAYGPVAPPVGTRPSQPASQPASQPTTTPHRWRRVAVGIGAVVGAAAMVVFGVTHTTPEVVAPHLDVTAAQYPHGDQVIVSWSGTDEHDDTTTRLTVDGQAPPRGCPRQITGSGSCTFTGGWRRAYTVGAFASSDKRSASSADRTVTTMVEPSVDVHPGSTFVDSGTTYCSVLVTLRGFAPNTTYAGIVRSDYTERTGRDPFTFTVATDSDGSLTDAKTGWGSRDPDSQGWIEVTVDGHTGRDSIWGCP